VRVVKVSLVVVDTFAALSSVQLIEGVDTRETWRSKSCNKDSVTLIRSVAQRQRELGV
jgi:hypothetical protein